MNIQLLAVDIGGVLAHIDKSKILSLCQKSNILPKDFFDLSFVKFQKGLISEEDFINHKSAQLSIEPQRFRYAFISMISPTITSKFIAKIRTPWIFFSSINVLHYKYFLQYIEITNFTRNNSILSFKENQLKPHRKLFIKLKNITPIKPSQILVIDDKAINISTALKFGFKAQKL